MREIAEHLHTKHGVKTAFYISGAAENNDSQERMETLFDYFQEIGMPLTQNDIGYGDYTYKSGFDVTDNFLSSGRDLPDAFIAANDKMAIGAVARLKLSGIEVPRDVIVTGYDDSEVANIHYPGITSVRRGEFCAGRLAYSLAKEAFSTGKKPANQIVSGIAAISESCGCTSTGTLKEELVRNRFAESSMSYEIKLNYLRHLMAESTSLSSYEEYLSVAKNIFHLSIHGRFISVSLVMQTDISCS
jgi:Transcriptional regulators